MLEVFKPSLEKHAERSWVQIPEIRQDVMSVISLLTRGGNPEQEGEGLHIRNKYILKIRCFFEGIINYSSRQDVNRKER